VSRAVAPGDRRERDAYFTPSALAHALVGVLPLEAGDTALEPSAGGGAFVDALEAHGAVVEAVDIEPAPREPRLFGPPPASIVRGDFLAGWTPDSPPRWVIGNPPYREAEAFVRRSLDVTGRHVVFLLRLAFLEGALRAALWRETPLRKVWVLTERPSFTGGGTDSAAYGWFWWDREYSGEPSMGWLSWKTGPDLRIVELPEVAAPTGAEMTGEQLGLLGGVE